jgi:hypothetical protein
MQNSCRRLCWFLGPLPSLLPSSRLNSEKQRRGYGIPSLFIGIEISKVHPCFRVTAQEVLSKLLEEGQTGAAKLAQEAGNSSGAKFGLMYSWHGKNYLGAAHGEQAWQVPGSLFMRQY